MNFESEIDLMASDIWPFFDKILQKIGKILLKFRKKFS
jgi:hypothetical protein